MYVSTPASAIEFVQPRGLEEYGASTQPSASSETWKSVIEQEGACVDQPRLAKITSQQMPCWTLTDAVGDKGMR
jgi:hypothetical protein